MSMTKVSRLSIGMGIDNQGRVVQQTHTANELKQLFVESGKYARIVVTDVETKKVKIAEIPLGALGWEFDPIE